MICQNCRKNEATMHMKRIINGRAAEVHLCPDCARSLGYGDAFSGFGLGLGELLGDLFSKGEGTLSGGSVKCPVCGKTFEDIASDGKIGCAECYNTFYDKLLPSIRRIHGKTAHVGKAPAGFFAADKSDEFIKLKDELQKAIDEQNFELAAELRDRINERLKGGGEI